MNFFQKYVLIAQDLKTKIYHGFFYPEIFLPSERKLASLYSANRDTIHKALLLLENNNIIKKINNHFYINPQKKDPNIADLLGENTNDYFVNGEELQLIEADKKIALDLNVLLGNKLCKFSYVYNQMFRTKSVPISFNLLYIPFSNLSNLNFKLDSTAPLKWFKQKNKVLLEKENLQLSLIKPNSKIQNLLQLNSNTLIVKRNSFFSFKNSTQKIKLISYCNPKYCIITQPVKEIRRRIGY